MENQNLIKNLDKNNENTQTTDSSFINFFVIVLIVIFSGIATGYFLSKANLINFNKKNLISKSNNITNKKGGILDKKIFKDTAEGLLKEGGIDGEGNYHLERPGGESQNVYLTSSTVDLSKFLNKKVKVWGQTFTGEKAGWLMDVGYIEVIE